MAHPFPLASIFTEGMRRDADRTMLPGGSVWNLVDFIPDEIQAAAAGRGGWTYAGAALTGATKIASIGYYPDSGKVIAVDQEPKAFDAIAASAITGVPTGIPQSPPAYHRGKLIFAGYVRGGGGANPFYYDGSSISSLSAPQGSLCAVYKDHAILANSSANPNRVWFSAAGDPTSWDTSFGWWDTTGAVSAVATTLNSILIFHDDSTERLRGTAPPPGSDMTLEPFFNDGCIDPFSVAYWQQRVVFASSRGIYLTDGVTVVDLTAAAQMKTYWISLMNNYSVSWRIAGGIYRDHYIITISNGSTMIDCLCVSLLNRTMWRFSNMHGGCFVNVTAREQEKTYMGLWNAGRVAEISSLWSPAAAVKQDGDGTNPTPIIETGAFRGYDRLHRRWIQSMGIQKWRWAYCDYDLRDAATDNPTITLFYALSPGGAYTALTGGTLPATTDYTRKRRSIAAQIGGAKRSNMLELKVAVNGPYASCNLYTLEGDWSPIDIGRL